MGVSGFTRPPERCEGGLSDVWLAAADDIAACTYDGATGTFGAVRLREGAAFARYEFAEDTARYRQYVSGDAPACVVHELSFALRRADAGSTVALASLLGATGGGFVALPAAGRFSSVGRPVSEGSVRCGSFRRCSIHRPATMRTPVPWSYCVPRTPLSRNRSPVHCRSRYRDFT